MMFKMNFREGKEMVFHEWNTLKADLMHEYGYDKDDLYKVLEAFVDTGIYKDAVAFIEKKIDFSEIRAIENEKISYPKYFCETWLLTSDETAAKYPTLREAIDFARHNHQFLINEVISEGNETLHSSYSDNEVEQMVKDTAGNVVFEIRFDGTEKKYF